MQMQRETFAYSQEKEPGTAPLTACSAAGVNISVLATVINSNKIWDVSQHEVITIALTKSINAICHCQGGKRDEKKCSWGLEADRTTDLSQMCIFKTTGEHDLNIWKRFCAIMWPL